MGANEKQTLNWLWNLELNHYLLKKDFQSAKELCRRMSENYPDVTTFGFLSEMINEKSTGSEMFDYFMEIKDKWKSGLKEPKQKLQFYKQSAWFYGRNKEKSQCANALDSASQFGMSLTEKNSLLVKYCQ